MIPAHVRGVSLILRVLMRPRVHTGYCIMGYTLVYWRFDRIYNSLNFLWPLATTSSRGALGEA